MTDEMIEIPEELTQTKVGAIIGAISWGIQTTFDELIYWVLLGIGAVAMYQGKEVDAYYIGFMGAILTDLLKKKFKSEE